MGVPGHFPILWLHWPSRMHIYGSVDLSNEGAPGHFFHLMEAPTMRLSIAKTLLCWHSRMQIYGLVENHTFLEQFVSRGVPGHFLIWGTRTFFQSGGTRTFFPTWEYQDIFFNLGVPGQFSQPCMAPSG